MKARVFFITILASISGLANADCKPDVCDAVYIDTLYVKSPGEAYIGTSGDETILDCESVSGIYATLDLTTPGANAMYSTLLSAHMADKRATIRVTNGSVGCSIGYVVLERQ
ncbi:hypothetical protein [Microbulbifer sp. TYP-18]|uniref:hypothetical protein n=1 Tax=Microbulbifer sp. TYP-18 TaxID=3230024 RepID=UPI0034C645D2